MVVVIDLFGDNKDVISFPPETERSSSDEIKKEELVRRLALEEIDRRAPQPQVLSIESS